MKVEVVTPPASEPVSLAEAKLFLRVDHAAEDALIASLVVAAREAVESFTARALVTRRVRETRGGWDARKDGALRLAVAPVGTVHSVKVAKADGAYETLSGETRTEDDLLWFASPPAPMRTVAGVQLEYDAGYGAASAVPGALRQAVLLAIAALYEKRDGADAVLIAARILAAAYARVRL